MLLKQPYFMENEDWYYYDNKKKKFVLTEKAPLKAKQSYEEHYKELNEPDPVLYDNIMKDAEKSYREDLKSEGKTEEEIDKIISDWLNS